MRRTWTIIGVGDVRASFRWYESLLGLPETAPAHDDFGQILDSDGTVLLCLHKWGAHEHPPLMSPDRAQPGNGLLLFFRVDNLDTALRRARTLVARLEEEPHVNRNTATMEFSLRDPDGYYVTVSALSEASTLIPEARSSGITIRQAVQRDEKRWRELFDGYCLFYKRTPSEPLTRHTWARIMDDASPIHAIVADDQRDGVIGIANYVVHEHTLGLTPACYLGDLFVDPARRAAGVGEQLIGWLVAEMKRQGWCRLYWHTRLNNYRARGLYDKFTPHSDFIRYTVYPEA